MPKIDPETAEVYHRQVYPGNMRRRTDGYSRLKLSDAGGLTQLGVGHVTLRPGGAASLFHWHEREDEFLYVLEGELTVIEGDDLYVLGPGESAAFKAGVQVGHTVENRSKADTRFIEIGSRDANEVAHYPELDMVFRKALSPTPFCTRSGDSIGLEQTPVVLKHAIDTDAGD